MTDDHRAEFVIAGSRRRPVALRAGCSDRTDAVGASLDDGSRVTRLAIGDGRCGSWTQVRAADGREGWVRNSRLQPADEAPEAPAAEPATAAAGAAVAGRLRAYAGRLSRAGAQPLRAAVEDYAGRVERVGRGELPPSAGANPSVLTPALVGDALAAHRRVLGRLAFWIDLVRNVLIFMPVVWMWWKFQQAVSGYAGRPPEYATGTFFDFWVDGPGGTQRLAHAAREVVVVLVVLVVVNVVLGLVRRFERRGAERDSVHAAREFAALLAEAEAVGAERRAGDPQEALAAFAGAGRELTAELRDAGGSLASSVRPLTDSVDVARSVMAGLAAAVERQQEQIGALADSLGEISRVPGSLAAIEAAFAEASGEARRSAEAIEGIRASLDPRTEELSHAVNRVADLASRMEHAASQIARATEDYGKSLAGFADGAAQLQHSARTMNEVAVRLREGL